MIILQKYIQRSLIRISTEIIEESYWSKFPDGSINDMDDEDETFISTKELEEQIVKWIRDEPITSKNELAGLIFKVTCRTKQNV